MSKYCSIMNMTAKSKNILSLLDLLDAFFGYLDQTNSKHSDHKKKKIYFVRFVNQNIYELRLSACFCLMCKVL